MKSFLLFLRYRLMTSARNVYVRFKAKLAMALFAMAKAISAPAGETKANRNLKMETDAKPQSFFVSDADGKRETKTFLFANVLAYIRSPIVHLREMFFQTKSQIDSAPSRECKTNAKLSILNQKSNAIQADGKKMDGKRNVSSVCSAELQQNGAVETRRQAVCKLDISAELFHFLAFSADSKKTEMSVLKAAPRFWIMPYVDENGILHIRQAYSAEMNGENLEVR